MSVTVPSTAVPIFTTAEDAIAAATRLAAELAEGAIDRDREPAAPHDAFAALDQSGLLSVTVPAQYGGGGLPPSVLAEVIRRIAAADPAVAQIPQGHYLFVDVIALWGSDDLRRRVFGRVVAGERLGNALAERGGLHSQDLRTRLSQTEDGLRLTGRKYYCTGAASSRMIAVSAVNDQERLSVAVVDRDAPGVSADGDWYAMGQRATMSGTVELADVTVDPANVFDYSQAYERPQVLGARAQLVHSAIEAGIAAGALRDAREFVTTRSRPFFEASRAGWGDRATDDPHTVYRFGRLTTQLTAAEQLLRYAGEVLDGIGLEPSSAGEAARGSLAVAQAKAFASETAVLIASDLFQLTGAGAADDRLDLHRHWRNARTHSVHDPVDWKYHHIGAYALTGQLPPNHGQL